MRLMAPILLIALLLLCGSADAQSKRPMPRGANGMIERLNRMTPEQRQRTLDRLPPERREKVERRLEKFNALPPEVKSRLREEYQEFPETSG